jgi:hypothetical protein
MTTTTPTQEVPAMPDTEATVREFCAQFPTPNTRALLGHCEAGRISWSEAATIARNALTAALNP